jgi:hypothetical protein
MKKRYRGKIESEKINKKNSDYKHIVQERAREQMRRREVRRKSKKRVCR